MPATYPFAVDAGSYDYISDAMVIGAEGGKKVCLVSLDVDDFDPVSISAEFAYADESEFFSSTPTVTIQAFGSWTEVIWTQGTKQIQIDFTGILPVILEGTYQFADSIHA